MWCVCNAVEAELELAHSELRSEGACSLDSFLDGNKGSEDVRASGKRDETRLVCDEWLESLELEADSVWVVGGIR